jgi:pimeloyl-ACP methyl ester carboxylesterase
MPLIVLTSTEVPKAPPGTPDAVLAEFPPALAEMHRGHAELAGLSSRGVRRPVPHSGHNIQDDQPEAVIGAIKEVISATREKAVK